MTPVTLRVSAESFVNSGRKQLQQADLARAILLERDGLRHHPTNRELQQDIAEARALVVRPAGLPPPAESGLLTSRISEGEAFVAFAVLTALTAFAAAMRWTTRATWSGTALILSLAGCFVVGIIAITVTKENRRDRETPFAVVSRAGILRTGNGESYPPRLEVPLPAGVEANVLARRGDWVMIELAGGIVGWLKRSDLYFGIAAQGGRSESIP